MKRIGKNYIKLVIANCINRFGDSIEVISLTWLIYSVTGSSFWSAIYYACNQLPSVLIQPFAGAIVEEKNKCNIMVRTDILRGIAVLVIALIHFKSIIHPIIAIIFTLFVSTVESFRLPAGNALITLIVSEKDYDYAISKNTSFTTISTLIGTAIAGLVIASFGVTIAIIIDALTFFISAIIISSIKVDEYSETRNLKLREEIKVYYDMFIDGIDYAKQSQTIKELIFLVIIFNGMLAPINSLIAPLVLGYYGLDSTALSIFSISLSLGMIVAGFTFIPLAERIKSATKMLTSGAIAFGLIYILLIISKLILINKYYLLISLGIAGAIIGYIVTANTTMLTVDFLRKVDATHISRIAALYNSLSSMVIPILALVLGITTKFTTIEIIYIISGIICLISAFIIIIKSR